MSQEETEEELTEKKKEEENNDSSNEVESRTGMKKYFDVHHPVFWPSSFLAILFIAITIIIGGDKMERVF
ncbi:MAG: hypothetical protein ABEH43_09185, partial [Flavobacteriales bacterium]